MIKLDNNENKTVGRKIADVIYGILKIAVPIVICVLVLNYCSDKEKEHNDKIREAAFDEGRATGFLEGYEQAETDAEDYIYELMGNEFDKRWSGYFRDDLKTLMDEDKWEHYHKQGWDYHY